MPIFSMISKHSDEGCPIHNEKMRFEIAGIWELTKTYGIKDVGIWAVIPEHLLFMVFEAPTSDAFLKFSMEPDMMKWIASNTTKIKMAMGKSFKRVFWRLQWK